MNFFPKLIVLFLAMLPTFTNAQAIDWYTNNPNASVFEFSTVEELKGLVALLKSSVSPNFTGKTIALTNDIDFTGQDFTGIPSYNGIFDGKGHTIYGLSGSLFLNYSGGQIKNVNIVASKIYDNGGLVRSSSSPLLIENCSVKADSILSFTTGFISNERLSGFGVGGLVGSASKISIINSFVNGNISATPSGSSSGIGYFGSSAGGLVGEADSIYIQNSYVNGSISIIAHGGTCSACINDNTFMPTAYSGGLVGRAGRMITVLNSYANVDISSITIAEHIGNSSDQFWHESYSYSGGLIGLVDFNIREGTGPFRRGGNVEISNSYANGNVSAITTTPATSLGETYSYSGGLIGIAMVRNHIKILKSSASGMFSASFNGRTNGFSSGGLIGRLSSTNSSASYGISDSYAIIFGEVHGGLLGTGSAKISNSYATGNILSETFDAGISNSCSNMATLASSIYYNSDWAISACPGAIFIPEISGKSTADLKKQETFVNWDFINVWGIDSEKNNGYPYLLPNESAGLCGDNCNDGNTPIIKPQIASKNSVTFVSNTLHLQVQNSANLQIYSLNGKLAKKLHFNNGTYNISLNDLSKGVYVARVMFGNENKTMRISVM